MSAPKKLTIKARVIAAAETLKPMATHTELRQWAVSQHMDNRSAFPKFKEALKEIGIDYDNLKGEHFKADEEQLHKLITHELTLYCDAKASAGRYGICDRNGQVIWYGLFFPNENADEQSRAELAAAKKAVWLAKQVMERAGHKAIELNLIIDAQWLIYQDHAKQKGYVLTQMAKNYNLRLNVTWIPGTENPADKWTVSAGYKRWNTIPDFTALLQPVKNIA